MPSALPKTSGVFSGRALAPHSVVANWLSLVVSGSWAWGCSDGVFVRSLVSDTSDFSKIKKTPVSSLSLMASLRPGASPRHVVFSTAGYLSNAAMFSNSNVLSGTEVSLEPSLLSSTDVFWGMGDFSETHF